MNKQIRRIEAMETALNGSREVIDELKQALRQFIDNQDRIRMLDLYYSGRQWRKDFEDKEAGKLPEDLRCGVLSEDAVYDLLEDEHELLLEMLELIRERIR